MNRSHRRFPLPAPAVLGRALALAGLLATATALAQTPVICNLRQTTAITATQVVQLDVLPIAVVYLPPGPAGKQSLADSQTFSTTVTSTVSTTNSNSQGLSGSAGTVSGGFTLTDTVGTQTGSGFNTVAFNSSSLTTGLPMGANFMDYLTGGSDFGGQDRIEFFANPIFVDTRWGGNDVLPGFCHVPGANQSIMTPGSVKIFPASTVIGMAPIDVTDGVHWKLFSPTVDDIRAAIAANTMSGIATTATGPLAGITTVALQRLLAFDPLAAGGSVQATLNGSPTRFQIQGGPEQWQPCLGEMQAQESNSSTVTEGTSSDFKETSTVTFAGGLTFSLFGIKFGGMLTLGSSSSYEISTNGTVNQTTGTSAKACFGGDEGQSSAFDGNCANTPNQPPPLSYFSSVYVDTVSGTFLFMDQPGFTMQPGIVVQGTVVDCNGNPPLTPQQVNAIPNSAGTPMPAPTMTDSNGQFTIELAPGTYTIATKAPSTPASQQVSVRFGTVPPQLKPFTLGSGAPGSAAALRFTQQPLSGLASLDPFSINAEVTVVDASGCVATSFNGPVTVGLATNPAPGNAQIFGNLTVDANQGVADFNGLWIDTPGQYALAATAANHALSVNSGVFQVRPLNFTPPAFIHVSLPALAIKAINGIAVPPAPKGQTGQPDIQLSAAAGNHVVVQVVASHLPRFAAVHLLMGNVRINGEVLPPLDLGSQVLSEGAATFTITLPTTLPDGVTPGAVLQAKAVSTSGFTPGGFLRLFRPSPVPPRQQLLAVSRPVSVRVSPTPATGPSAVQVVAVDNQFPSAPGFANSGVSQILLPPGTNPFNVLVVLASGFGIPNGAQFTLLNQNGAVLGRSTLNGGVGRVAIRLPAPPPVGTLPSTTLQVQIATGGRLLPQPDKVVATIARGFVGPVKATPIANGLNISWTTDPDSQGDVLLTSSSGQTTDVADPNDSTFHDVVVPALDPLATYLVHVTATHPPLNPWTADATAETGPISGDLTGDGKVTVADAVLAIRSVVGLLQPTDDQILAGDINESGQITLGDAIAILRTAVGL